MYQEKENRKTKGSALARCKGAALRVLVPPPLRGGSSKKVATRLQQPLPLATPDFASRSGLHDAHANRYTFPAGPVAPIRVLRATGVNSFVFVFPIVVIFIVAVYLCIKLLDKRNEIFPGESRVHHLLQFVADIINQILKHLFRGTAYRHAVVSFQLQSSPLIGRKSSPQTISC